jgi:hypothetical protein
MGAWMWDVGGDFGFGDAVVVNSKLGQKVGAASA